MSSLSVILITGANHGLGWYACQQLAKAGTHHVLVGARDPQQGSDAVSKILDADPGAKDRLETIQLDVTSGASIEAAVAAVQAKFDYLDVLVNNAGAVNATDKEASLRAQYHEVFNLNVFSHVVLADKFLPLLLASPSPSRRVISTGLSVGSMATGQDEICKYFARREYRGGVGVSGVLCDGFQWFQGKTDT